MEGMPKYRNISFKRAAARNNSANEMSNFGISNLDTIHPSAQRRQNIFLDISCTNLMVMVILVSMGDGSHKTLEINEW